MLILAIKAMKTILIKASYSVLIIFLVITVMLGTQSLISFFQGKNHPSNTGMDLPINVTDVTSSNYQWGDFYTTITPLNDSIMTGKTYIVAASDATDEEKARANYVCGDGTYTYDDQYINAILASNSSIELTSGTYNVYSPILADNLSNSALFSNSGAVIKKPAETKSLLKVNATAGQNTVTVISANGFSEGWAVAIRDNSYNGGNATYAKIMDIEENVITLDTALSKSYTIGSEAYISNEFVTVKVLGCTNSSVKGLTIDGNSVNRPTVEDVECPCIWVIGGIGIDISYNYLHDFSGDGITVATGNGTRVHDNTIINGTKSYPGGKALHDGGSSNNSEFTNNYIRNCRVGFYFCLVTTDTKVESNTFENCSDYGVQVQLDGMNNNAIISDNVIKSAGHVGVYVFVGNHNTKIVNNNIIDSGSHAFIINGDNTTLERNTITNKSDNTTSDNNEDSS